MYHVVHLFMFFAGAGLLNFVSEREENGYEKWQTFMIKTTVLQSAVYVSRKHPESAQSFVFSWQIVTE